MPNIFQSLNNQTLETIIKCDSHEQLVNILGDNYKKISQKMPYFNAIKKVHWTSSKSWLKALELAEIPVELLWIIVGFVSLGAGALWILGVVGFVVSALFIGAFSYYSKKKHEKMIGAINYVEITEIKTQALDELITRYKPSHVKLNSFEMKLYDISANCTKSIGLGFSLFCILGMTYLGVTDILYTVGVVSAASLLVTPIGLVIALGVAALMGIVFAIHYHYFHPENVLIKSTKKFLEAECYKREIHFDIFKKIKNNAPIHTHETTVEQKEIGLVSKNDLLPSPKKLSEFKATRQNHRFFRFPTPALETSHKMNKLARSHSF